MEVAPNCISFALNKLGLRKSDTSLGYTPTLSGLRSQGLETTDNPADAQGVAVVSRKTEDVIHMAVFTLEDKHRVEQRKGVGIKPRTVKIETALRPYKGNENLDIVYLKKDAAKQTNI